MIVNLAHPINYIIAWHMRSIDFIVHRLFDVNCQGSDLIARYMISLEGYLSMYRPSLYVSDRFEYLYGLYGYLYSYHPS